MGVQPARVRCEQNQLLGPASSSGPPGNSDAVWPSGPMPICTRSSSPAILISISYWPGPCPARHRMERTDVTQAVDQAFADEPLVCFRVVRRHQTLVTHVDVDQLPVHPVALYVCRAPRSRASQWGHPNRRGRTWDAAGNGTPLPPLPANSPREGHPLNVTSPGAPHGRTRSALTGSSSA